MEWEMLNNIKTIVYKQQHILFPERIEREVCI